jgi:hypothetical protein
MELKNFKGLFSSTQEYQELVFLIKQRKNHPFKYTVDNNVIKVPCLKI